MVENGEVVVSVGGRLFGPIQKDQLAYLLIAGDIIASDYVYLKAQARWVMLCELEVFSSLIPDSEPPPFEEPSYFLYDRSGQLGPFTKSHVVSKIQKGLVTPYDYILKKEEGRWLRLGDLDAFVNLFPKPPEQEPSDDAVESLNSLRGRGFQIRSHRVNQSQNESDSSKLQELDLFENTSAPQSLNKPSAESVESPLEASSSEDSLSVSDDSVSALVQGLESQAKNTEKLEEDASEAESPVQEVAKADSDEGRQDEGRQDEDQEEKNTHLDLSGLVTEAEDEQNTETLEVPEEQVLSKPNSTDSNEDSNENHMNQDSSSFLQKDPSVGPEDTEEDPSEDLSGDENDIEIPTLSGLGSLDNSGEAQEDKEEKKVENQHQKISEEQSSNGKKPKESEGALDKNLEKDSNTDSIHLDDGQTAEHLTIVKD
jgi:hypothetical protein